MVAKGTLLCDRDGSNVRLLARVGHVPSIASGITLVKPLTYSLAHGDLSSIIVTILLSCCRRGAAMAFKQEGLCLQDRRAQHHRFSLIHPHHGRHEE
jgi:hypothetical protein